MKALILHGTGGSHESNWLPWLSDCLQRRGWETWVPDLPNADEPDTTRYNDYLLQNMPWKLDGSTVIVGHSSGALAALGLLQEMPLDLHVRLCVLVGAFKNDLGWPNLGGLFRHPYDFDLIRKKSLEFVLYHSDTDPYCPLDHAEFLAQQLNGDLRVELGQGHFSVETEPPYKEFPQLLKFLETVDGSK